MIPWELLDAIVLPGSGEEFALYRHDKDFSIRVAGQELMSSRMHGSEEALATITCRRLEAIDAPRLLIGGLGMGFTLRAALDRLPALASVVVAELSSAVVRWNRDLLAALAGRPLEDARVTVVEGDVTDILRTEREAFDGILMDVDNGPEAFTIDSNDWLYGVAGLEAIHSCLRPGGVLAVWSAEPDRGFTKRLRRTGFQVDDLRVPARGNAGGRPHTIWTAERLRAGVEPGVGGVLAEDTAKEARKPRKSR